MSASAAPAPISPVLPSKTATVEIEIGKAAGDDYSVALRITPPGEAGNVQIMRVGPGIVPGAKLAELKLLRPESDAYGTNLAQALFADSTIASKFAEARAAYLSQNATLRVFLIVLPGAEELNGIRWESLRDLPGERLFTGQQILFSRFLTSMNWDPPRFTRKTQLKALVAVANPKDLPGYKAGGESLAPIDDKLALERAGVALKGIRANVLEKTTLDRLAEALQEGYDILYLVCHGAFLASKPHVYLEKEDGTVHVVPSELVAERFRELRQVPRLVVLGSCQSAGAGRQPLDGRGLAALGPRLAGIGVPAVVAMQGNLTMESEATCMPVFFRELRRDGQIDRAMAVARSTIRNRPDYWVPMLYMRLAEGRLWRPAPDRRWMLGVAAGLVLAVSGGAFALRPNPPSAYTIRVSVVDPNGAAVEEAAITPPVGGEVLQSGARGTYEVRIPAAALPVDRKVSLHATLENAFQEGDITAQFGKGAETAAVIHLKPKTDAWVHGVVLDSRSRPAAGVPVRVNGSPDPPVITDQSGQFKLRAYKAKGQEAEIIAGEGDGQRLHWPASFPGESDYAEATIRLPN